MIRPLRRILGAATAAVGLLFCLGGSASAQSAVILPGHVPRQIRAATRLERAPADERVDLSLVVRLDQGLMDQTLARLYGSNAPRNKSFLSSADFAQTFDLARKRQALKEFARAAGLTVDTADDEAGSLVVKVYGPSSAVETAFGVQLHHYQSADGQVFRANETEPSIPQSLTPHLNAVLGLSNFRGARKPHFVPSRPASLQAQSSSSGAASPALSGTTGLGGGLSPANIKSVYGLTGTLNGSGQTVALYELDGYRSSDIALYVSQYGLASPTVTCTSADGTCGLCGANQNQSCTTTSPASDNGMIEVALDIEMMIALAPGANIQVYTAKNSGSDPLNAYASIAAADTAKVISTSWGEDEEDLGGAVMSSEHAIFQQMATQGQAIFAAAGDAGAYDASGVTGDSTAEQDTLLTDDPASQPFVTGVGGTSLSGAIGGSITETVWNNGCASGTSCAAGGGGIANYLNAYWPIPSYQTGVAGEASTSYRNVPDVSLNADPQAAPYSICVGGSCNSCGNPCTTLIGGTSAAAPLWAALTALINQQRIAAGGVSLGYANTPLYALATGSSYHTVFNDITSGGNGAYTAGIGYDDASGWGSFKADALITALSVLPKVVAASPEFTGVGISSLTVNWVTAGQLQGTVYTAQISTNDFSTVNESSITGNASVYFGTGGFGPALIPATTYYFQVQSTSGTSTAVSSLGTTVTPAAAPTNPILFNQVWVSSLTMQWANPGGNPAGTEYQISYWQAIGSTTTVLTTSLNPTVTGLAEGATYTFTVGALNALGQLAPSGVTITTVTISQPSLTTAIPAGGGTATIHPPEGIVSLLIPGGALTQPVAVTLSVPASFPASASSAGNLSGTGIGIDINTNPAVEPLTNTMLSISYLSVGSLNPHELVIARYDPTDNVWVPLVSSVDAVHGTVTGMTSHWSLFQVMQNAPSQTIGTANAYPNPWRVSQGPAAMTFSQLPAGARLRIYTLAGRIVKDFSSDASGMASWDGTNESGRPAASGFYFLFIEGAGNSTTLKLALQR